jgi:putative two-component system response regulator
VERTYTVLVVDDTPDNINLLYNVLNKSYRVKAAPNGKKALEILRQDRQIDMVLLDIMMPEMDGYEVCKILKNDPLTAKIPVIFVTALSEHGNEERGLALGAVDYITKPINPAITLARVRTHLALYDQNRELEQKIAERTRELKETRLSIIRQLGRAAEFKDNETGLHVIRMSHYARLIAESMLGEPTEWTDLVFQTAAMHDVGKIGIPDGILLKPGKLDADEWKLMQKHPQFGAEIIGDHPSELLRMAREIALTHHEKWDGTGYPAGLSGDAIPLCGRIAAVADVFDALTSVRPYKKAWSTEDALARLDSGSGKDFDPAVVDHFHKVLDQVLYYKEHFADAVSVTEITVKDESGR